MSLLPIATETPSAAPKSAASGPPALRWPPVQRAEHATPGQFGQEAGGMSLGFIWRSIQQWWTIAVPVGIVCAILAGGVTWATWKPKYKAMAILQIWARTPTLLPGTNDESPRFAETQTRLLAGPVVIRPALANPEIAKLPEIMREPAPVEFLLKNIKVIGEGQSELYRVEYTGENAEHAAIIVNGIVDEYQRILKTGDDLRRAMLSEALAKAKQGRQDEINSLQAEILVQQRQVIGKNSTAQSQSATASVNVLTPLFSLQQRMVEVEAEREVLQAQVKVYGDAKPAKPVKIPDEVLDIEVKMNPEVREHTRRLTAMRLQLDDIEKKSRQGKQSKSYTDYAAQIAAADKELKTLQDEVRSQLELRQASVTQTDRGQEVEVWRQRLTALDAEYAVLKRRYEQYEKELGTSGDKAVMLQFKHAQLERESRIFDLIEQRKLQNETEILNVARVEVRQRAEIPEAPVEAWPLKPLMMFSGAAFVLPFLVVIGWERISRRIGDAEQLSSEATLTIVGEIAQLPTRPVLSGGVASRRKVRRDLGLFQESVDSLRTCLLLSESTAAHRVFAVTSAVSGEGKTSLVSQLAISLARATGKRVLMIDADMRSPNLHDIFETRLEPGLANALRAQCEISDAVVEEVAEGVHLMPAGRLAGSPHNYLSNDAMSKLVGKLRDVYDYIVVDTPPILCASEALVIARAVDGTLLCALRDVSRSRQVRLATERLNMAGVNLMGAVLSGTSFRRYASTYGNYAYLEDAT
jgi:succinoglycan biosynthesis transport protein ExoP